MPRVTGLSNQPVLSMPQLLRSAALLLPLAFVLVLAGCKPSPPPPDTTGLAVRQTVMLAHPGALVLHCPFRDLPGSCCGCVGMGRCGR